MSEKIEAITSVTEFFASLVENAEKIPGLKAITEHIPGIPLASVVLKQLNQALQEKDPERLGFHALTIAYQETAQESIRVVGPPRNVPMLGSRPQLLKKLKSLEPPQVGLLRTFSLDRPNAHPFLWQANAQFEEVARFFGYDDREWRLLVTHVRENFPALVSQTLAANDHFKAFREWLLVNRSEDYAARTKLLEIAERQRRAFEDRPVLNIEPFSLSDVYLDTECGELTWGQIVGRDNSTTSAIERLDPFRDDEKHGGRKDLLETVLRLLGDKTYRDAIVVQGPPGCGKSAFTLRLSSNLLKFGFRPVRVRLKNLLQSGTLWEDISQAVQVVDEHDPETPAANVPDVLLHGKVLEDSLPFHTASISSHVLIFDGWDEISRSASKTYKSRVKDTFERIHDNLLLRNPPVRVILTGRPSEAIDEASILTNSTKVLTVRPLRPNQVRSYVDRLARILDNPTLVWREEIQPWRVNRERLEVVLAKYQSEFEAAGRYRSHRLDILAQPLLLHLAVRVIAAREGDPRELIENPTHLFRNLIDQTAKAGKAVQDDTRLERSYFTSGHDLRDFLRKIALAIQESGSETITQPELEARLKLPAGRIKQEAKQAAAVHPLSELLISFYFKTGPEHLGCEFLHKSFREYLTAEAIVEILKAFARKHPGPISPREDRYEYWEDFALDDPRHALSRDLGRAVGPQWLRASILKHISELIGWEIGRAHSNSAEPGALNLTAWKRLRDVLADLWDWWAEGVPLRPQYDDFGQPIIQPFAFELVRHAMPRIREDRLAPPRTVTIDSNLGEALCHLNVAVHFEMAKVEGVLGLPADSGSQRIRRCQTLVTSETKEWVRFAPGGELNAYFHNYVQRIDASGSKELFDLWPIFADLRAIDLHGANLRYTNLTCVDLRYADLGNTDLTSANLTYANLAYANLSYAVLFSIALRGTNLHGANLKASIGGGDVIDLLDEDYSPPPLE